MATLAVIIAYGMTSVAATLFFFRPTSRGIAT